MYDNVVDAKQYLRYSIVRYKKEPVMVEEVEDKIDGLTLYLRHLKGRDISLVKIDDPDMNYKPVPLGYGEVNGRCFYACRLPVRRWKQGLSKENLGFLGQGALDLERDKDREALRLTILGKFKTFKEAVATGGAFDREFFVRIAEKKKHLEYKGRKVGSIINDRAVLSERFNYLEAKLEEVL